MSEVGVGIRAFHPADWDDVCDVHARAARAELTVSGIDPGEVRPMADDEDLDAFLELNRALVACRDDRVVGFVAWRDRGEWRGSGYLSWLYVDPAHHRRGIGAQLLRRALEALGDQAWTLVKRGNDPAIRLYEGHGMQIVPPRSRHGGGSTPTEIRLALPTSRKRDPDTPNFGA